MVESNPQIDSTSDSTKYEPQREFFKKLIQLK